MIPKSLRWRIQLWYSVSLALVVGGLLVAFHRYERRERIAELDTFLQRTMSTALPVLVPPWKRPGPQQGRRPGGAPPRRMNGHPGPHPELDVRRRELFEAMLEQSEGLFHVFFETDGRILGNSPAMPADMQTLDQRVAADSYVFRTRNGYRELFYGVPGGRVLVFGIPLAPMQEDLRRLGWQLLGIGLGIFLLVWLGGWWVAGRALRPIDTITAAARRVAAGQLSERIEVNSKESELGRLSAVLNDTFEQLEGDFLRQSRFTSDASHELRTPVSVLLSQTQLALMRERSPDEYREALAVCQRTAQRMRELIDNMLELAAIDSGEHAWRFDACDLATVVRDALDGLQPLAEGNGVALREKLQPAPCVCDAGAIGQLVSNLVSNAIKHHRPKESAPPRQVTATTFVERGGDAVLEIADNGPGIAAGDLPHIFDRFYRADKARTRKTGSTGLGLSISYAIAEAHGGRLTVESVPGEGARFSLRLPIRTGEN